MISRIEKVANDNYKPGEALKYWGKAEDGKKNIGNLNNHTMIN
ncbi:MAG: hypothetical protein M0T81_07725 [Thermoplasmatales archaeon]|jgi:hypothetical protein|nr:hypothetical protein [Thermoplasmatales archaeon]